ncbi:phage portal protein [Paenibacillus sp. P32E]|uniref:phage portal protein n=1 Tax=Paenibacillus sp. P32E TaxID=1349434 RepID=UPI00093EC7E6|nr:phage portal protein [Paenibacillus sp. P32E]OKP91316.1 phage portal protein [Paenibacillus sp. P32E]
MARWRLVDRAVGEMSKLRQGMAGLWGVITGTLGGTYRLDSSRVDYAKARALYDNTEENYKLGAGFAKKVVNATVGFIGLPEFKSIDEDAQKTVNDFLKKNESKAQRTHLNAIKEGDCFVWLTREKNVSKLHPEKESRLVYNIIPPEQVKRIDRDPLTGEPMQYVLEAEHTWYDESGTKKQCKIKQKISAEQRLIEVEGDRPPNLQVGEHDNPWGFIPIVHFKNDGDETNEYGKSDLESIEPFLKVYHDVFLAAIQGSKMHSTPRLKLKLKDVPGFLLNNFGVSDPKKFAAEGGKINLNGKELLIFQGEEDASFIEAKSATGDATALLEFVFYCIVSASETPEFIFGVHTPSSLSSVKEQMPIFIQKVERKRKSFTDSWQLLARMVLSMTSQSEVTTFDTYETTLVWETVDQRDSKDVAEELKIIVEALDKALAGGLISEQAAVEYLSYWVDTMHPYNGTDEGVEYEKDRILKTKVLLRRLEDGELFDAEGKVAV